MALGCEGVLGAVGYVHAPLVRKHDLVHGAAAVINCASAGCYTACVGRLRSR